jgi:hypothetical protein
MRRTQLYLEDEVWKTLQIQARQAHSTISELVRQAIREKYLNDTSKRKETLLSVVGIWRDRTDLPNTETYIRRLRKGDRLKRIWK